MFSRMIQIRILLAICFALGSLGVVHANSSVLSRFNSTYGTSGTVLDTCITCHTSGSSFNPYGAALSAASDNFQAIENVDSDGDGYTNIQEIMARTFPGDPTSHPTSGGGGGGGGGTDSTPPVITAFSATATSGSLTVAITSFTATDNVAVTGYLLTESSAMPSPTATGWLASPPTSYTFTTPGMKTLYAWATDAANNISASMSVSVTVTSVGSPGGPSGMSVWQGQWFKLFVGAGAVSQENNEDENASGAALRYLKVGAWDPTNQVFQTTLYTLNNQTGQYDPTNLPLHFTTGETLRFFGWLEYADQWAFTLALYGQSGNAQLHSARLRGVGVYLAQTPDQSDGWRVWDSLFVLSGTMVPASAVPPQIPH